MKLLLHQLAGRRAFGSARPTLATILLLAALPVAAADTPYTATGWVIGVPVPGIWCTNALGQVGFRGNAHLARVVGSDERLTGRRTIFVDGAAQADGSSIIYGPVYHEVGTWDAAGTNFTPTGGMWENSYRGTMGTDGSLQLHIVGTGSGGTIDGLRLDETLTRVAGPPLDPTIPYQYTGTIKPPPVNTNLVLDDFSGPAVGWQIYGAGSYSYTRPNAVLVVNGYWPGVITRALIDSYTFGGPSTLWTVADGQTLETRVDLVNLNARATAAFFVLGNAGGLYAILKGHDFVSLHKWSTSLPWGPITMFRFQKVQIPDSNVVLALALKKTGANVEVTARVLDKSNTNSVLYVDGFTDTPNADPALTSAEFLNLSGMQLSLSPDLPGAPLTTAGGVVGVFQYNPDGQQPAAIAIYDNLQLSKYEIPPLGIQRAMRLTWPAPAAVNWAVVGAPTVQGPYTPVQDPVLPGLQQMTVPASELMQFFRLRQAP
jgi:hypothetical protein